ncbi:MAG TPA: hypothetical protein DIU00_03660 [Phycisphaerales bacterium]|nr:hypothetical protein [Phycisphaerales bacterium]
MPYLRQENKKLALFFQIRLRNTNKLALIGFVFLGLDNSKIYIILYLKSICVLFGYWKLALFFQIPFRSTLNTER